MRLTDSRRLTGPSLYSDRPGAICDVDVAVERQDALVAVWARHATVLKNAVGWQRESLAHRLHDTGAGLFMTAPVDVLYAATEVNEAAVALALAELAGGSPTPVDDIVARLRSVIDKEAKPALTALLAEAALRGVPALYDDDALSMGVGKRAVTWPIDALPKPEAITWPELGGEDDVPVALITGTNGKSTTVRLAASIVAAGGRTAGVTSTDYVRVGDDVLDEGDYSGPGGARLLLRHPNTEVALLEVARGGLLRRGLGVPRAHVAVVTNVAEDHLGEYGINTLQDMRDAKFLVQRGVAEDRPMVLNADDLGVVDYSARFPSQTIVWFSEDVAHPTLRRHVDNGGLAFAVDNGQLGRLDRRGFLPIVSVDRVPITLGGAARHNVQNALAAAALCHALGCEDTAIADGLVGFDGGVAANPGRGNVFEGNGVRAIVDFAHNEHGLRAMAGALRRMDAKRRLILLGQAGDRSDALVEGLTRAAMAGKPDQLVVCELPGYERGRDPGDVPEIIARAAVAAGLDAGQVHHAKSPVDGTRFALEWARDGDVLLLLALTQRGPCTQLVQRALGVDV